MDPVLSELKNDHNISELQNINLLPAAAAFNSLKLVLKTFGDAATAVHSRTSCLGPGKDAVMSTFCVLLCNMISAHHILPAGSVEEVSSAASSSGVSLGILSLCSHNETPHRNVLTSVLACLFQMFAVFCAKNHCLAVFCFLSLPCLLPSISLYISL